MYTLIFLLKDVSDTFHLHLNITVGLEVIKDLLTKQPLSAVNLSAAFCMLPYTSNIVFSLLKFIDLFSLKSLIITTVFYSILGL